MKVVCFVNNAQMMKTFMSVDAKIRQIAVELQDSVMLSKLAGGDVIY